MQDTLSISLVFTFAYEFFKNIFNCCITTEIHMSNKTYYDYKKFHNCGIDYLSL